MMASQVETQRAVAEIQAQLDQMFNLGGRSRLRRTASTASLSSVASFAVSVNSKEAWKQLCRDLHSIGVTADMIEDKKDQILGVFQNKSTTLVTMENTTEQTQVSSEIGHEGSGSDRPLELQHGTMSSAITYSDANGVSIQGAHEGRGTSKRARILRINWKPLGFLAGPLLLAAAKKGDIDAVRLRLAAAGDINFSTNDGRTALHLAAEYGHPDIIELLLERGADIYATCPTSGPTGMGGRTALDLAVSSPYQGLDVIRPLLKKGLLDDNPTLDLGSRSSINASIVKLAIGGDDTEILQLLLRCSTIIGAINDSTLTGLLHKAALEGRTVVVQQLLEKGANLEATNKNSSTVLQCAAQQGHREVVQLLAERGANIEATDNGGSTALHRTTEQGHGEVVQLLLEWGANIEAADGNGSTALHHALFRGQREVVQLLVERGANIGATDSHGSTALHHAALQGDREVVQLLVERGADIEATDILGLTALHHAVLRGHREVVQLLLERGANIEARASYQRSTPLHRTAERVVVQLLFERGANIEARASYKGSTPLHCTTEQGDQEVVRLLLERGANVEATDNFGLTALHRTAEQGHREVVQLLLERGANIEARARYKGSTPLHCTAEKGHLAVVQLLLERGANIEAADGSGLTALHRTAEQGHREVVQLLLERGANTGATDNFGLTALHRTAKQGHREVVQLLLERGANIEATDSHGSTALHHAVLRGQRELVQLLLERGARLNVTNNGRATALHDVVNGYRNRYSLPVGYYDQTLQLLLDRGIDVDVWKRDKEGVTAMELAERHGLLSMQGIFRNHIEKHNLQSPSTEEEAGDPPQVEDLRQ